MTWRHEFLAWPYPTAPLPDGWVEETDAIPGEEAKAVVYRNLASGVRTYEHPSDEQYRAYYRSMKVDRCRLTPG